MRLTIIMKHMSVTRHRKGRGSCTYSLRVGVCLYLTPYQHALQWVGIKFMMFATMTRADEVYKGWMCELAMNSRYGNTKSIPYSQWSCFGMVEILGVRSIFPKWLLSRAQRASAALSKGKTSSITIFTLPDSISGHTCSRTSCTICALFSAVLFRKPAPVPTEVPIHIRIINTIPMVVTWTKKWHNIATMANKKGELMYLQLWDACPEQG